MKRFSLLTMLALGVLLVFAIGSTVSAGEDNKVKDEKALNASSTDKAGCCPNMADCCKDKTAASKSCTIADCKGKGKCDDACMAACGGKGGCGKHTSVPCNPGDCKHPDSKPAPSK